MPGNHDWYDGLDGFGRLFRRAIDEPVPRRRTTDTTARASASACREGTGRKVGLVARSSTSTRSASLYGSSSGFYKSVRAFFTGDADQAARAPRARGYEPVQEASYFALPLAPGLECGAPIASSGASTSASASYFIERRKKQPGTRGALRRRLIRRSPTATGTTRRRGCSPPAASRLERDRVLYLARRLPPLRAARGRANPSTSSPAAAAHSCMAHAFAPYPGAGPPERRLPGRCRQSEARARLPFKLMTGAAGLLPHMLFGLLGAIQLRAFGRGPVAGTVTTTLVALACIVGFALAVRSRRTC